MLDREILLAIADGRYNLLLGAGFSIGAKNGTGRDLPSGYGLLSIMKEEFGMQDAEYSLQNLYETLNALGKRNGKNQNIGEFLKEFFSDCVPEWHGIVSEFNWNIIWTLNIDDLLEQSIRRNYNELRSRSFIWTDQYHDRREGYIDIVHLHGFVNAKDPNFVFSISQYREAAVLRQAWHSVFGDHLPNEPFIIVGSALQSEFDFQDAIVKLEKRRDTLYPTIVVTRSIDVYQREILEAKGVIIIEMTAQDFFEAIIEEYRKVSGSGSAPELASYNFALQFSPVDRKIRTSRHHDFYSGDEPSTNDIIENLDCPFDTTIKMSNEFKKIMLDSETERPVIGRISGLPGSGKTTALLRIGKDMKEAGFDAFYYNNLEDMDINSVISFSKGKKIILLFDNAGVFMPQIVELIEECNRSGIKIGIIYSDREKYSKLISERLKRRSIEEDALAEYNLLSSSDARKLYNLLDRKGRLGRIAGIRDEDVRFREFNKKRQLVNIMYALNNENAHRDRMMSEFVGIDDPKVKLIYIIACAMNSEGFKLTLPWISAFLKISQDDIIKHIEKSEVTMLRINHDGKRYSIGVKNRFFSQDFMRFHNKQSDMQGDYLDLKFHVILHFLKWISTHVDQDFYDHNSKYYQVTVRFLSYNLLRNWLSNIYVNEMYKELKPWWNNNARFWEQYALFHAAVNEYPVAVSYANNALRSRSDGFTNNTAGKIMMERSYKNLEPGTPPSIDSLFKGIEHLHDSYLQDNVSKYQFNTFFSNALRYIDANRGEIPEGLSDQMDTWFSLSRNHSDDEAFESQIRKYRSEWLRAQFPDSRQKSRNRNAPKKSSRRFYPKK